MHISVEHDVFSRQEIIFFSALANNQLRILAYMLESRVREAGFLALAPLHLWAV